VRNMVRKEVTVLLPIYIKWSKSLEQSLKAYIRSLAIDFSINRVHVLETTKRFTRLMIEGEDANIMVKFLEKELGKPMVWNEIKEEEEYKGRVIDVRDDGVLVDIGLIGDDYYRIKVPFEDFVRKIFRVKTNIPREIFDFFGIRKYFPLSVKVNFELELNERERIAWGLLGRSTVKMLRSWFSKRFDRIVVYGATRSQVEKAIRESRHVIDILNVERLGFLEHIIICKWGTSAKGLIPEIGPFLPQAYMGVFMPRYVKKKIKELSRVNSFQ